MIRIDIKPLSINQAYKGKRFRTDKYNTFIKQMMLLLPPLKDVPTKDTKDIKIRIEFGYSSMLSDADNGCKTFLDCLVKRYGFDDRYIMEILIQKKIVDKGKEYIIFGFY